MIFLLELIGRPSYPCNVHRVFSLAERKVAASKMKSSSKQNESSSKMDWECRKQEEAAKATSKSGQLLSRTCMRKEQAIENVALIVV